MGKFRAIYATELTKIIKSRAIIITFILILLTTLLLGITNGIFKEVEFKYDTESEGFTTPEEGVIYYQTLIAEFDKQIASGEYDVKFDDKAYYASKSCLAYYTYLVENDLTMADAAPYGESMIFNLGSGLGFIQTALPVAVVIIIIFAIVMACTNLAGEFSSGVINMALLRPIKRSSLISAKWLAVFTVSIVLLIIEFVILMAVSTFAFNISNISTVLIVNGTKAIGISTVGLLSMELAYAVFSIFAYIQLAYFISSLTKSKTAGIVLPLIYLLASELITFLLGKIYIGYIDFGANISLLNCFTINGAPFNGMNIYSCAIISLIYIAIFMFTSYRMFIKKDIKL